MADCQFFNFIVWGVIGTVICCFGFIGNMLSLVTFQKDRRSPATTLLQCLASSDFMLLLSVFITDGLPYICDYTQTCDNPWSTWPYIRYIWLLTPISHMCSIWFVVLIAFNRFFAVCLPHRVHTIWDNAKTPLYVACALLLVISFNLPRFFEYEITEVFDNNTNTTVLREMKTEFGQTKSYRVGYKVMLVNILLIMVPIASLIVLTFLIIYRLAVQRSRMSATRGGGGGSGGSVRAKSGSRGARAASEITLVLVVVVIVSIVCQTPLAAFHFVRYQKRYGCGQIIFILDNVSKLLVNVNSCVNFIIYCVASPKFRAVLLAVVTCDTGEKVGPSARGGGGGAGNTSRAKNNTNGAAAESKV